MELTGKSWWQSKTVWAGVIAVLLAAYNEAVAVGLGLPPIPDFVYGVLGALGIYGRAAATKQLGK
jgi:hypothetical protein